MEDDFDLEGLSHSDAREYVLRFAQSLHVARRQRADAERSVDEWKRRVKLAIDRGQTELARQALERAEEAHRALVGLKREEHELDFKVTELKRRLAGLPTAPERSVDANGLLASIESVVGSGHETDRAVAEAEAEVALDALRKRIAAEQAAGDNDRGDRP